MKSKLDIWKIGGNVVADENQLNAVLTAFANIQHSKILVHGGGPQASDLSAKLGMVPQMIGGRRITDAATLEVVVMVYAGLINKDLVARLQAKGVAALGLCGADADIIRAEKRTVADIDFGYAGDIDPQQSSQNLKSFLSLDMIPVLCPLTHNGQGQLLNTNADTISAFVAQQLCKDYQVNLLFCFDKPGVLLDPEDSSTLISKLPHHKYMELKNNGCIVDGMVPKLDNAFTALSNGVDEIRLCDWQGILKNPPGGTLLCMN